MLFVIDFSSDEAYYMQLRKQIILGIASASIRNGESLPSVRDMAENVGINMHTVNKAYSILKQEGYLTLDRRRGAVVSVNIDKAVAMEKLREEMKVLVAQAVCNDISPSEVHDMLDDILSDFENS